MTFGKDANVTLLVERARAMLVELPRVRTTLRHAIDHEQWFVVCCMCSLVGELVFVALDRTRKHDKFPKLADLRIPATRGARHKQRGHRRNADYYFLAALRHTCFHPAMRTPLHDLPRDIFREMSSLHTIDAADWSLEKLDVAMRFELGL